MNRNPTKTNKNQKPFKTRRPFGKNKNSNKMNGLKAAMNKEKMQLNKLNKKLNHVENMIKPRDINPSTLGVPRFRTQDIRINSYIQSLRYNSDTRFGSFPLANTVPYHYIKKQTISTTSVNSSGNAYIEISPSHFALADGLSLNRPMFVLNDNEYLGPNATNNTLTTNKITGGSVQDCQLSNSIFHKAIVVGYTCTITITGLSALNRTGNIHAIELYDDRYILGVAGASAASTAASYINAQPLSSSVNLPNKCYKEYSSLASNSITYKWIPPFNHSMIDTYDFDITSGPASNVPVDTNYTSKRLAIYAYSFPVGTLIQIEHKIYYQATPLISQLTNYPVTYGEDYRDCSRELQILGAKNPFSFTSSRQNIGYTGNAIPYFSSSNVEQMIGSETVTHYDEDDYDQIDMSKNKIVPDLNKYTIDSKVVHQHNIKRTKA